MKQNGCKYFYKAQRNKKKKKEGGVNGEGTVWMEITRQAVFDSE